MRLQAGEPLAILFLPPISEGAGSGLTTFEVYRLGSRGFWVQGLKLGAAILLQHLLLWGVIFV